MFYRKLRENRLLLFGLLSFLALRDVGYKKKKKSKAIYLLGKFRENVIRSYQPFTCLIYYFPISNYL